MLNSASISLYIHVPFCVRECRYCDFYSTSHDASLIDSYIDAVIQEWVRVREKLKLHGSVINTVYFGGGTPSLLSTDRFGRLFSGVREHISILPGAEITLECNPDSFTEEKAAVWLASGVNRLSIGIQSLNDRLLRFLGRPHSAQQALNALSNKALSGFASIGVDVMYGLPGQTIDILADTLNQLLAFPLIKHVSAYELTLNEHTPFGRHRQLLPFPSDDAIAEQTEYLHNRLTSSGFEHYEVSNFAKPGFRSQHNQAYWQYKPYIGLGPSAHSFFNGTRWANLSDTSAYIQAIQAEESSREFSEVLTPDQMASELVMLGLRTLNGLSITEFERITGQEFETAERTKVLARMVEEGLLVKRKKSYCPTYTGMLFADRIAGELG